MAINETDYLIWCLAEECSEVIKECSKSERFGLNSCNPYDDKKVNNAMALVDEVYDVRARAKLLFEHLQIPYCDNQIYKFKQRKAKLEKNMAISRKTGALKEIVYRPKKV